MKIKNKEQIIIILIITGILLVSTISFRINRINKDKSNQEVWTGGMRDDTLFIAEDGRHVVSQESGFIQIILSQEELDRIKSARRQPVNCTGSCNYAIGIGTISLKEYEEELKLKNE